MRNGLAFFLALLLGISASSAVSAAEDASCGNGFLKNIQAVECLVGFSTGKLREQRDYRMIPLMFALDFNFKELLENKTKFKYYGLLQFQIEPYISTVYQPDPNVELGNGFVLKLGLLPERFAFQPYVKGGAGMSFMSQHTREQSTGFNFYEYVALGGHYFLKKSLAVTVEYRFRHLSNAGIDHPNKGIESHFGMVGVLYSF